MPVDREQERAARAFARVQGIGAGDRTDFLQKARELPAILRTNGLLAGWAYLQAKHQAVADALREHLEARHPAACGKLTALFGSGQPGGGRLTTLELQRLTAEAVVYAGWLKRAAEAVCNVGGDRDEGAS
jgi:CRISPR/Cas system CMR-associated protein Cmr5 small subunit